MRTRLLNFSILTITALIAALPLTASFQSGTQQIKLVARDMKFYLAEDPYTPNPTIQVKGGQQVRIVLENRDRGITHDFVVSGLPIAIAPFKGGRTRSLLVRFRSNWGDTPTSARHTRE
jgi:hypothetical protein